MPCFWETGGDGGNTCRGTAAAAAASVCRQLGSRIMIQIESVGTTTEFGSVPSACHAAVRSIRGVASVGYGRVTVYTGKNRNHDE